MKSQKTASKSELARLYKVHLNTFSKWLKSVPGLDLKRYQRILTPKQVQLVFEHLGEP